MAEKRKKHAEGDTRPTKKYAAARPIGKLSVEHVDNSDLLSPLLVSAPGLSFPAGITFRPFRRRKILPKSQTSELILHSSQHPRLDYLAREEKDGSSENLLKDYVGIFDPAAGRMQLIPARRLVVRRTLLRRETEEQQRKEAESKAAMSTPMVKRHALAAEFGSKKSRKAIKDKTLNAILDTPTAANSTLRHSVADNILQDMSRATAAMPSKQELVAAVDSSKPRPPVNTAAETAADVYPIDTVVGRELMQLLPIKGWVDASEAGTGVRVGSRFVAMRIVNLVKNKELQKLKVLRFIMLCLQFDDSLSGTWTRVRKAPQKDKLAQLMGDDVPEPVINAITRKFVSENYDMTRWHTDNLKTHICAAALIVDDFKVDMNELRTDMKLDHKQIRQYFHELGCRVGPLNETDAAKATKGQRATRSIAKLELPLQFPTVKFGRYKP